MMDDAKPAVSLERPTVQWASGFVKLSHVFIWRQNVESREFLSSKFFGIFAHSCFQHFGVDYLFHCFRKHFLLILCGKYLARKLYFHLRFYVCLIFHLGKQDLVF